uniref:TTF-type domain-containing protein n=1 Tax=Amphilophus citrinellus TaxID=61819 RepID=A0A3Q0SEZ9_AMPCI
TGPDDEEGEEQRGPDDDGEREEQIDAAESAGARPYSEDPAEWPSPGEMGNSFRQYIIENGPQKCSHGPYPRSDESKRCFSKVYCFRLLSNGEKVERDWLLYSKSSNRVYCFACKLFGEAKCLSKTLTHHETSGSHINAYLMWKELASRLRLGKTIDSELQRAMAAEKAHWRSVLTQVIDCILFLAERNLPLRGKNAQLGNPENGNFLGILELIARYDVTLAEHLRKAVSKKAPGYLSWCTQNEFLNSISECVLGKITAKIKSSKYFAVELDCTPNISKQEQASVIIWYIHTDEKKKVTIAESFVGFAAVKDTTGKGLTDILTGVLDGLGLDLANCRGQSYDNECPGALFIPCCSHSLNLLLCDAAASNKECLTFFGTIQRLYTIFSSSVKRWDILTEFVDITLKPLSDTQWEAKLDSVKAVHFQLGGILDVLEKLEEVAGDSKIVSEAKSLSDEIVSMEFHVCLLVWYDLLLEINFASKALQAADVSLDTTVRLIDSLKEFLLKYREERFQKSLEIAARIATEMDASPKFKERRFRKQKRFQDDNSCTAYHEKEPERHFRCMVFNVIVDTVLQELSERFSNLQPVSEKFKFITKMEHMTKAELEESVTAYALTTSDVSRDIIQEIYPASRLLMTMPLTVASAERSFSKLKLIKTYLRSSMSSDRLTQLAVIAVENRVARSISYDAIFDKWASAKA